MIYCEAPNEYIPVSGMKSVFMGGGIQSCRDWQAELVACLVDEDVTLINPRRVNFPMDDPSAAEEQIKWEHKYLRQANAILFWFPNTSLCPITLYELGAWSMTNKPLFIGMNPRYARRQDVEIQTSLVRPDVEIVYSIRDLAGQIQTYLKGQTVKTSAVRELVRIARVMLAYKPKPVPTTLFEKMFYDIRETAKKYKEEQSLKAKDTLTTAMLEDLKQKNVQVVSLDIALGKYRGSRFVTSAKLFVRLGDNTSRPDNTKLHDLEKYLQVTYSPKFSYKSFEGGVAFFNIR